MKEWIDEKTIGEGWTALHYASFQGNVDGIYALLDFGADYKALNNNGLNMLHVAAQGDTAPPLYLFKELGLDINAKDKRGSTPLHWACYSQSETAITYLLAWAPQINVLDREGYTPLHLAVRSVDALESCRPVRSLLIKGARIDIRDHKGRMPFDYVRDVRSQPNKRELVSLLARNQSNCHAVAGTTPVHKVEQSYATIVAYFLLYGVVLFCKVIFVYPWLEERSVHTAVLLDVLTLGLHFALSVMQPGFLRSKTIDFARLLETFDSSSLCPECEVIRTAGSRHCIVCHRCVDRYDHHCPWINNCVGIRNHNIFLMYLNAQVATILYTIYICLQVALEKDIADQPMYGFAELVHDILEIFQLVEYEPAIKKAAIAASLVICFFFVVPLLRLLHVQIGNFLVAKTTNERYARASYGKDPTESSETEDYNAWGSDPVHEQPKRRKRRILCKPLNNCRKFCMHESAGLFGKRQTQW
jgi:palmitoyltransferase ZDHHC13/17